MILLRFFQFHILLYLVTEAILTGHYYSIYIHVIPPGSSGRLPEMELTSQAPGKDAKPPEVEYSYNRFFFQNCPFFARIYGTDLKQQMVKGLTS